MRIRRRPPQIPAPVSSDPAAGGSSPSGGGTVESVSGAAVGIGEMVMGTAALHRPVEARGKGGRPWGPDSVSWRLGQPGGGGRLIGNWTDGGSDASCYGEVQVQQKRYRGKAGEQEAAGRRAEEEPKKEKDQNRGAAQPEPAVGAHKPWNHMAAAAAANGSGAGAFVSTAGPATGSNSELAGAARKRIAWSSSSNRWPRSPSSSSSSSVKTEISNGGGITSYMHGGDRHLVKDEEEEEKKGEGEEKQQLVNGRGDNSTASKNNSTGKRRRSPAVLMEGSRCSRVNGRGWRCCQQTLVGYSLCEHHLGKGRLRSVSSVRCKKTGSGAGKQLFSLPSGLVQQLHDNQQRSSTTVAMDDVDDKEIKPSVGVRRRKRVGIVKARSINSLLGQTSCDVVDHAELPVALLRAPASPSAGFPASIVRGPAESTTPASATAEAAAAASFPPPTAAHPQRISAIMKSVTDVL